MEDISLLNNETLPELKQVVDDYPYFHTARMLYLKNLAILNDVRFGVELKKTAIYIPDRRMLYMLIEEVRLIMGEPGHAQLPETGDPFELIDQFLNKLGDEPDPGIVFRQPISSDYTPFLTGDGEASVDAPPLKHEELINDFLDEEQQSQRFRRMKADDTEYETPESIEQLQNKSGLQSLNDSYFTETLARIFIKQKRYDKALQIIKNLSLNYPEKNIYFADQIRFLEKLIINIKKYS
ncbi:MAG: hypothetical protein LBS05_06880 [Tannerellaceae bacterium]|nr:hypothetical protein [Tannerellaceae bacterium]